MNFRDFVSYLLLCVVALLCTAQAAAEVHVVGYVRDAVTREPVAGTAVTLVGTTVGTIASENGGFTIDTSAAGNTLRFTATGYRTTDVQISPTQTVVVVDMKTEAKELDEVVVTRSREKYSKKNNPAVDLVRRIRHTMSQGDPMLHDYYTLDKYQLITYGFADLEQLQTKYKFIGNNQVLNAYADTSTLSGERVLPLSVREQTSQEFYRRSPSTHRSIITGERNGGIDESFDPTSIKAYLEDIFREVDIFGNDITLMSDRFVSPLAAIGPDFYKYYLTDTLYIDGTQCIELSFAPHTPETFGFNGRLYVALGDSLCFIKRITMNVPPSINLNYVERLTMQQTYERAADGTRLKTSDDIEAVFRIVRGTPAMMVRRETAYTNHRFTPAADNNIYSRLEPSTTLGSAQFLPDDYWSAVRPRPLRSDGNAMQRMLTQLRQSKAFYWTEKVVLAFVHGYVPTGNPSKFDFGPINTTISHNSLEGLRLRIGGTTTVAASNRIFASGWLAYGTRDTRLKYMAQLEYSFVAKKRLPQDFPVNSLRLMHCYDIERLGQHYAHTNADNMFLMLKRANDNKLAYSRLTELEWLREWPNHVSVSLRMEHLVHEASRLMPYTLGDGTSLKQYTQAGFCASLRIAPGEKFYQTRRERIPINQDAPIVTLTHTWHPKGWLGTRHEMHRTELSLQKRFWFSAFGYLDVAMQAAKIWNAVSFPDLLIPNANLSYTIQPGSFTLLDAMEFVNDQQLTWDVTYWGGGVLFNRVPLLKRLKLREVISWRGVMGDLRHCNNPANVPDAIQFPQGTLCQRMSTTPYMELGVGLDNILTILRVDYVWRLTYRSTPGVDRSGVRIAMHFNF